MSDFWFVGGHLGWPLFALFVFSALCVLIVDLTWRVVAVRFYYLLLGSSAIWLLGVILIVFLV